METKYQAKDFSTDLDIKWCPGCGDYSILKQMQSVLPEIGIPKEKILFVSGIGCSSRFPYYMNTFGMHSIHGRAPAIAAGAKIANPDLSVWIITGDGDALSIGGNHLIHAFRRNLNVNIILFNNEIYGLTKGQFSPTSSLGLKTKTSPLGVIDYPFNPMSLSIGAGSTFVSRSLDRDPKHLREILSRAQKHKGTSFVEIYQNCAIFNNNTFESFTDKNVKDDNILILEQGKPLVFGKNKDKGIRFNGTNPEIVDLNEYSLDDLWIHDERNKNKAYILAQMSDSLDFPRPFGVFYEEDRYIYEEKLHEQINFSKEKKSGLSLDDILKGKNSWTVQ